MNYLESYKQSIENPELFWEQQSKKISWHKEPTTILDQTGDYSKWFEGGYTNLCYLAVDKHIEDGFGEQNAIIYDSPVTQRIEKITFNQLLSEVNKLAAAMKDLGLNSGDVAIIYMPMIPQAIYAMLACARIGVTHSVVFGGFAPNELAIRIDDCKPKIILTASSGIEVEKLIAYKPMVDEAINLAVHKPNHVVVYNRKFGAKRPMNEIDLDFDAFANNSKFVDCVPLPSNHPSYILYTSGTTGKPKGVVRDTGGYATALQFSMTNIYNIAPGKVFWAASDVGWVVGHSYIVYGPLINRNTTVLFEGKPIKTPDASTFWRVIAEHRVEVMFTAPTAIRAIRKEDPDGLFIKQFDLTCLKYQFLAGERCDISTLQWLEKQLNIPVIDHWWQTESGWPMVANPAGIELMPTKAGSAGLPVHGYDIRILNELGEELAPNCEGFVAVKLPLPPGTLLDIWQDNERFKNGYLKKFKGFYFSGDGGYKDDDGYVYITGRVDDVINVAGHRLSTAEMEEIVSAHTHIAECAVIGVNDQLKGQIPMAFVVEKNDNDIDQTRIQLEVILAVREKIGAVASLKDVVFVKRLPKTRSGKILRKLLRQIIDKEQFQIPSTIDDVAIIPEIEGAANVYFSNKTHH